MEKAKLPSSILEHTPWENEVNPIWLATSFSLNRNLTKFHFPPKLNERFFPQTIEAVKEPFLRSSLLNTPVLLNSEDLNLLDKDFLFEHFLCRESFQNTLPGQGFVIDQSGCFFAEINLQDHLNLQMIDTQGSWEKAWNTLSEIETAIGSSVEFAFSPKFGYLTSEPTLCGTGLCVRAFLHLPALIHTQQLQESLLKQKEEDIIASGMNGSTEEWVGDLVVISNKYTLGVSEEMILRSIHSMAMKLMALEKSLRSHLHNENNSLIKDLISRSFGLLLHSYQLQTKEALNALSLLKLGLHLDWVEGINDIKLNSLFFQCRRAHLLHQLKETQLVDPQEIARKRAEFLHKNMQGVSLKFEIN
jgi:protein arginine kinase